VLNAVTGIMSLIGRMDRPPTRLPGNLSYYLGGAHAALGTMVAFQHRELTGRGQRVSASLFEAFIQVFYRATAIWHNDQIVLLREDFFRGPDGVVQRDGSFPNLWDCSDGRLFYAIDFTLPKTLVAPQALLGWMHEDGYDPGELGLVDWDNFDHTVLTPEVKARWATIIGGFFKRHTMKELFEGGMIRKLGFSVILPLDQVLNHEQLKARNFWHEVEHEEAGCTARYPGHLFLASEAASPRTTPAPRVGEHNAEVFGQLGLEAAEIDSLSAAHVI
jgi:benzylsuccinate CoA-transferase BbsE subunit